LTTKAKVLLGTFGVVGISCLSLALFGSTSPSKSSTESMNLWGRDGSGDWSQYNGTEIWNQTRDFFKNKSREFGDDVESEWSDWETEWDTYWNSSVVLSS